MMKDWWSQRTVREQRLLQVMTFLLSVLLLYFFILSPISNTLNAMKANVAEQQSLLDWMHATVPQLQSLRTMQTSAQSVPTTALLTTIDHSLTQSGIKSSLNEMKQINENTVQLKFTNVNFDDLIDNIIVLQKNYGIVVNQAELAKGKKPGYVDGDINLEIES